MEQTSDDFVFLQWTAGQLYLAGCTVAEIAAIMHADIETIIQMLFAAASPPRTLH